MSGINSREHLGHIPGPELPDSVPSLSEFPLSQADAVSLAATPAGGAPSPAPGATKAIAADEFHDHITVLKNKCGTVRGRESDRINWNRAATFFALGALASFICFVCIGNPFALGALLVCTGLALVALHKGRIAQKDQESLKGVLEAAAKNPTINRAAQQAYREMSSLVGRKELRAYVTPYEVFQRMSERDQVLFKVDQATRPSKKVELLNNAIGTSGSEADKVAFKKKLESVEFERDVAKHYRRGIENHESGLLEMMEELRNTSPEERQKFFAEPESEGLHLDLLYNHHIEKIGQGIKKGQQALGLAVTGALVSAAA